MDLASYFNGITEIAGVELLLLPDGDVEIQLAILSKKGNKIQLQRSEYRIQSFGQLNEKLAKDIPVALSISGKGIIHRKITSPLPPGTNKINAVLPTANAADFYLQESGTENNRFLSLARRTLVDNTLAELEKEGIAVVALSLGPFSLEPLLSLVQTKDMPEAESKAQVSAGHHFITVNENLITGYQWAQDPSEKRHTIQLGNERMQNDVLVAYSAAFQALLEQEGLLPVEKVRQTRLEYRDKIRFRKTGTAILTAFLLLLLINFGLFTYFSPYGTGLPSNPEDTEESLADLRAEVAARESMLEKLGWTSRSAISYMADRIAATVPSGINLTLLSVNPPDEQMTRQERKPVYQNGIIHISGNCRKVDVLNQWVHDLKQLGFSELVSVTSYQYVERDKRGEFMLSITTRL